MPEAIDYDLIVIGAGGAGLAGAIWAAEAGCKVMILESEDRIGGSTALSDGVFNAADTSLQRKLGLTDSIDAPPAAKWSASALSPSSRAFGSAPWSINSLSASG